jgi:membrane protein YdbS with pleckstrin-like domain
MLGSRHFKKLLGNNEKISKKFTLSKRYLKIKFSINLFLFLIVIVILGASSFFFQSFSNNEISFDPQLGINIEQTDSKLNQTVVYSWLILLAIYFLVILPIAWFYYFYYLKISNQYVFTNQRIIIKKGWLNIKTITIHYNRMTDASIKQDLIDRLIKIGTLSISTAGSEGYRVNLKHIERPNKLKQELYNLKEDYRQNLHGHKTEGEYQHY